MYVCMCFTRLDCQAHMLPMHAPMMKQWTTHVTCHAACDRLLLVVGKQEYNGVSFLGHCGALQVQVLTSLYRMMRSVNYCGCSMCKKRQEDVGLRGKRKGKGFGRFRKAAVVVQYVSVVVSLWAVYECVCECVWGVCVGG